MHKRIEIRYDKFDPRKSPKLSGAVEVALTNSGFDKPKEIKEFTFEIEKGVYSTKNVPHLVDDDLHDKIKLAIESYYAGICHDENQFFWELDKNNQA